MFIIFSEVVPTKVATQRFRDEFIVRQVFQCWKNFTNETTRLAELRRRRVVIDFREFWFQDAFSRPFYSYFRLPMDFVEKTDKQHRTAYRLNKRLVRATREQPKQTMKNELGK